MTTRDNFWFRRQLAYVAMVMAVFAATPALAQRKPIVIEPSSQSVAAATRSLTILRNPGSYVLVRDLVDNRAGFDAVQITASNVTIDIQGFSIIGTVAGTGIGINANGQSNVVIQNGIITGMAGGAIVTGANVNISKVTASANSTAGITNPPSIMAGNGSNISDDTVSGGNTGGIGCAEACLVRGNVLQSNAGIGITLTDVTSGYSGNVLQGNDGNTVGSAGQILGGTSIGTNVCNGTSC
jgi:hypothetical protein